MIDKQLTLLGQTVLKMVAQDSRLYHIPDAGVDVHDLSGTRIGWAALSDVTAGAVTDSGVYLGTSASGVYNVPLTAFDAGGDQTAALTQSLTTTTNPSLHSDAIAGMDGSGTALLITTDAGTDYLPSGPDVTTVYRYSAANGCGPCAIGGTQIAYETDGKSHVLATPLADWTDGDVSVYEPDAVTLYVTKLSDPTALTYEGRGVAWNGDYLAVTHNGSPYLSLYKRSGDALTRLTDPTTLPDFGQAVAWSGNYLAVAHNGSPYLSFYRLDGDVLTRLTDPAALAGRGLGCAWSGDYLAVSHYGSPYLSLYKRNGDTLIKLTDPTGLPGSGWGCSWNGDYLAVAHEYSPYLSLYKRNGDTLIKLTDPTGLPGSGWGCSWNGDYLAVAHDNSPYLSLYRLDGDTLTRLSDSTALSGRGYACAWVGDKYLLAAHDSSPYLSFYRLDALSETLTKEASPPPLAGGGRDVAIIGSYVAVAHNGSPYLSFYKAPPQQPLLGQTNALAFGDDLFIATTGGINIAGVSLSAITDIGTVKNVKCLSVTPGATAESGMLAYGTTDGQNGGQFGVIDLSA